MRVFVVWKDFGVTTLVAVVSTHTKSQHEIEQDKVRNSHQTNPRYFVEEVTVDDSQSLH